MLLKDKQIRLLGKDGKLFLVVWWLRITPSDASSIPGQGTEGPTSLRATKHEYYNY